MRLSSTTIVPGVQSNINHLQNQQLPYQLDLFDQHKMDNIDGLSSFNLASANIGDKAWIRRTALVSHKTFLQPLITCACCSHVETYPAYAF